MHRWVTEHSVEVEQGELVFPLSRKVLAYLQATSDGIAEFVDARRLPEIDAELLLLEVQTSRPQRPVYSIHRSELVGVVTVADGPPSILALREDFPDTVHQNLMPDGLPRSLCIDDRPWAEAKTTYTGGELIERIATWFKKAGRGELHDASQPIDPMFVGELANIIVPASIWENEPEAPSGLFAFSRRPEHPTHLITCPISSVSRELAEQYPGFTVTTFDLAAQPMARIEFAPLDLRSLHERLAQSGTDLVGELRRRIPKWLSEPDNRPTRLKSRLAMIFRIPIVHPVEGATRATSTVAFVSEQTLGEVGESLGVLLRDGTGDNPESHVIGIIPGPERTEDVALRMALVHRSFDGGLAADLANHSSTSLQTVAVVGGGAIGSGVAECLVREGFFKTWIIIDNDTFLPHNEARHTLTSSDVGLDKAVALAQRLRLIRPDIEASAVVDEVPGREADAALNRAAVIVDASASVPVARYLSDYAAKGRLLSVFFNPSGTAAVILVEDTAKAEDLRALEAVYHRAIQTDLALHHHLDVPGMLPYAGACRTLTSRIPASRAISLSGLVANAIPRALSEDSATIRIWTMSEDGSVTVTAPAVGSTKLAFGAWTVVLPRSLSDALRNERDRHAPSETGGALLGIVDIERNRVDIVDALTAPPDSVGTPTEFVRGTTNLRAAVEGAMRRSLDQIRYVGEWHSHPPGSSTRPSTTDLEQICWLTETLSWDAFPGVMLIVGENGIGPVIGELVGNKQ